MRARIGVGAAGLMVMLGCGGAVEDSGSSAAASPSGDSPPSTPPAPASGGAAAGGSSSSAPGAPPAAPPSDLVAANPAPPGMQCEVDYASRPGITGGRIYWPIDCVGAYESRRSILASAPVTGGTATVAFSLAGPYIHALGPFAVDKHVVFQPGGSSMFVIRAGMTDVSTLPSSGDQCASLSSDDASVYCLKNTLEHPIMRWPVDSLGSLGPQKIFDELGTGCGSLTTDGGYLYLSCGGVNYGIFRLAADGTRERLFDPQHSGLVTVRGSTMAWATRTQAGDALIAPVDVGKDTDWPLVDPVAPGVIWFMRGAGAAKRTIEKIAPDGTTSVVISGLSRYAKFTVDSKHVYWVDAVGVHRRPKP